ncbi:hypothetical protein DEA8626_03105 [Defluviimonas aquaemixtae]|uniref:Lecithin:cholesterol acyltransferase n=1 Tax=Albidovulum aquaemixtae TaxID=1542388 RepID=A0A2R8BKV6_9RHOB|nr:alpha/beta hydrolase [Defluviimonas aquaemixtae]SPH24057.1 hypothetical protein DEA8626_03105 [Defluviimonas aquaemixtae]
MQFAVVIPGIMGTRLYLRDSQGKRGDQVWPPTPFEATFGYNRLTELQRPDLLVGEPIDNVLCYNFYNLIDSQLEDLGFRADAGPSRRISFGYDWRIDILTTADALAQKLGELHAQGATDIALLAHSMGGLIARLMLEGGKFDAEPWFGNVRLLAMMGTPHMGAPLALARIFGRDSAMGISGADFAKLASNRDYPSGYQLIPAPGETAIWNLDSTDVAPLDPYDPAVAADLGMDSQLVARAKAVHDVLGQGNRPDGARYIYFAGAGHRTATRINVRHQAGVPVDHSRSIVTRTQAAGDGTVPLYSALPVAGQRQIVVNEHATVFKGLPFRKVFFRLMGGDAGEPIEELPDGEPIAGPRLHLSLDAPVYDEGGTIEVVCSVTDPRTDSGLSTVTRIDGALHIQEVDEQQVPKGDPVAVPVSYSGPALSVLTIVVTERLAPGLYNMRFDGNPPSGTPAAFSVRKA